MKKECHPPYQKVLFIDSASGHRFVCGSTLQPKATEVFEGSEYPVVYLSISSTSHPFFTGSKQLVDSEGRVDKFKKRFERKKESAKEESSEEGGAEEKEEAEKKGSTAKSAAKKGAKPSKK
ncbi:MAG: type B 50S ribosomal protein L31 [Chlamydiales bacterium]